MADSDHSGNLDDAWQFLQNLVPDWELPDFPTLGLPEGWDVEAWLDEHWDGRGQGDSPRGLRPSPKGYGDDHRTTTARPKTTAAAAVDRQAGPGAIPDWFGDTEYGSSDDHRKPPLGKGQYTHVSPDSPQGQAETAFDEVDKFRKTVQRTASRIKDRELGLPDDRYRVITNKDGTTRTVKVAPTQMSYNTEDEAEARAWLEKQKTKKGGLDAARQKLFYAGGYGDDEPVFGDQVGYTDADVKAVQDRMNYANSAGALLGQILPQMAKQGRTQGFPVGTKPEAADGSGGSSGGGGTGPDPLELINEYADLNGLQLTDDWVHREVRRIGAGKRTVDESLKVLQRQVIARYPAWKEEIKDGLTVTDIASPYQQLAAQTLELPQESIGLNDPLVQRGLQGVGKNGEPSVKPLWQFQDELKKDPRWQYTDNAWAEVGGMAEEAMRMFGMMP